VCTVSSWASSDNEMGVVQMSEVTSGKNLTVIVLDSDEADALADLLKQAARHWTISALNELTEAMAVSA